MSNKYWEQGGVTLWLHTLSSQPSVASRIRGALGITRTAMQNWANTTATLRRKPSPGTGLCCSAAISPCLLFSKSPSTLAAWSRNLCCDRLASLMRHTAASLSHSTRRASRAASGALTDSATRAVCCNNLAVCWYRSAALHEHQAIRAIGSTGAATSTDRL
jgi:hypothetical protein